MKQVIRRFERINDVPYRNSLEKQTFSYLHPAPDAYLVGGCIFCLHGVIEHPAHQLMLLLKCVVQPVFTSFRTVCTASEQHQPHGSSTQWRMRVGMHVIPQHEYSNEYSHVYVSNGIRCGTERALALQIIELLSIQFALSESVFN